MGKMLGRVPAWESGLEVRVVTEQGFALDCAALHEQRYQAQVVHRPRQLYTRYLQQGREKVYAVGRVYSPSVFFLKPCK
jgi:hypothetical protein